MFVSLFIFCIRLQLQPGPLHSLSPGRLTISPQPKSLKRVYQQVINTEALASPSLLISKGSIWTHTLWLFHFFSPRVLYFPPPSLLANATTTVLHFNSFSVSPSSSSRFCCTNCLLTFIFFHACFSKTVFILYCGLWRMWSQAIGKVSNGRAMLTLRSAAHTLSTGLPLFLPTPHLHHLGRKECVFMWQLVFDSPQ